MPLNDETREKIRNVFLRTFEDLPVAKDLPRLAKFVTICDEDGRLLPFSEQEIVSSSTYVLDGVLPVEIKIFLHIRRVLLTLTTALEGEEKAKDLDKAMQPHFNNENFFLPEVLGKFMATQLGGDESKVVRVLKCANQAAIAPPVIELKFSLGVENTTKDVANSWKIIIIIASDKSVRVINQKKEVCVMNRFMLEWELSVNIPDSMDRLEDIYLKIIDVSFNPTSPSKRVQDLRNILKKYCDSDFWNLTANSQAFLMLENQTQDPSIPPYNPLPGEILFRQFSGVNFIHHQHPNQRMTEGVIYLTNYWIYFLGLKKVHTPFSYQIPISAIAKINKRKEKKEIEIICKDIRTIRFSFQQSQSKVFLTGLQHCVPMYLIRLFAVAHSRTIQLELNDIEISCSLIRKNGWKLYDFSREFRRLGFSDDKWRLSSINKHFQLCESYPQMIGIPKNVNDAELLLSAQFRKNGRLPVVTWKHRNNSVLSHGSIPDPAIDIKMTNLPAKAEDEKVFFAIIQNSIGDDRTNSFSPPSTPKKIKRGITGSFLSIRKSSPNVLGKVKNEKGSNFFILDIYQKADANRQNNELNYDKIEAISVGRDALYVESLVDMKESYRKLHKLCTTYSNMTADDHWYSAVDATHWLQHSHNLMFNSARIVQIMSMGCSLYLSYSEDRWDRCCQLSSLSQLWMDPYYRTLKGFIVLIEKEWISFGHPFADRCGYLSMEDNAEIIPVFIQFLDCVWQTLQQFPNHFEFNNNFLIALAENLYSGAHGTFISNNDGSIRNNLIRLKTESIWTNALQNANYKNPYYIRCDYTLSPSYNQRSLLLWSSYFLRWYDGDSEELIRMPRQAYGPCGQDVLSRNQQIRLTEKDKVQRHIARLERAAESMQSEIQRQKEILEKLRNPRDSIHQLKIGGIISNNNNNNNNKNNSIKNSNNIDHTSSSDSKLILDKKDESPKRRDIEEVDRFIHKRNKIRKSKSGTCTTNYEEQNSNSATITKTPSDNIINKNAVSKSPKQNRVVPPVLDLSQLNYISDGDYDADEDFGFYYSESD